MVIRLLTAAAAVVLAGLSGPSASAADAYCGRFTVQREVGILLPAYFYPDPNPASTAYKSWKVLARDAKRAADAGFRLAVIVNPNNGDFTALDPNYKRVIDELDQASALILGYVYTTNGTRPLSAVTANIASYRTHYPNIDGFFVDESLLVANRYGYYGNIRRAAIKAFGSEVRLFGNSGVYPTEARYDEFFDVTVVFEDRMSNFNRPGPGAHVLRADPARNAFIINAVPGTSAAVLKNQACTTLDTIRFRSPPTKNAGWWFMTTDGATGGPAAYSSLGLAYTPVFQATCAAVTGKTCP